MKMLYYLKTTLKGMFSNILGTAAYFIIFPIILAGVFTLMENLGKNTEVKLKQVEIQVVDKEESESSKALKKLLENENIEEFLKVSESGKNKLVIEKGYEESLLKGKENKIKLEVGDSKDEFTLEALKTVLDKYHENYYTLAKGGKINENETFLKENILKDDIKGNTFKREIGVAIGFIMVMLIQTFVQGSHTDISVNFANRLNSLPLKRRELFSFEIMSTVAYSFIVLSIYIFFFRAMNVSFNGDLLQIIVLILITSLFITGIVIFIGAMFGKKLGKVIGTLILLLFVVGGDLFGGIGQGIGIKSITEPLDTLFKAYNNTGTLLGNEKIVFGIVLVSIALILISGIKESLKKEVKA